MRRWTSVGAAAAVGVVAASLLVAAPGPAQSATPRQFGQSPYEQVVLAAAGVQRSCSISNNGLAALVFAVTWPETGAGTGPPSPMTLSRYDNQSGLYFEGNRNTPYRRAFWHPGVGMWQFDSAGLGAPRYAAHYISAAGGAPAAAGAMASRYCSAVGQGKSGAAARAAAWAPWHACRQGQCETIFNQILANGQLRNISGTSAVSLRGGMVSRLCGRRGSTQVFSPCFYVDPARAEGQAWWANPGSGQSPITAPFYVFETGGYEYRVWLRQDTGYPFDIEAARPLGQNARSALRWNRSTGLCAKVTASQRFCDVSPSHPFYTQIQWVAAQGIATGDVTGDFRPAAAVSRQAMAAFMYRLRGSPTSPAPRTTAAFGDVQTSHSFHREIDWLSQTGVVQGYPDGSFRPLQPVSRQAMAAFLYRLAGEPAFTAPAQPGFSDTTVGRPFYLEIHWLAGEGISAGYDDGTFRPDAAVSRMAMAAFLQRFAPA